MSATAATPAAAEEIPDLREIPGPSAFGDDRQRFWELLWIVSRNEFRQTYANTALGFLWTLLKPLLFFGVIFVVLRGILRFGAGIENYPLILVLGLIMFLYFQETTTRCVRAIPVREGIIRKTQFPRIIVPLSISLASAVTMLLSLLAVMPLFFAFGVYPQVDWLLAIPVFAVLILYATALGLILGVGFLHFEDVDQIWSLICRMLLYASPILFPIEVIPEPFEKVMTVVNPLAPLIELGRVFMIDPAAPGPFDVAGLWLGLVPFAVIAGLAIYGLRLFRRQAPQMAELL